MLYICSLMQKAKTMKLRHYLFVIAISAMVASCSKGDTGPAGPVGATGTSGINGSANIIASTYTVITVASAGDTTSSWVSTGAPAYHWVAGFIDTNITANNVDVVEAYWSTSLGGGWSGLPVTSLINRGDEMNYRYNNDSVAFTYYTGGTPYTKYPGYLATSPGFATIIFKVIVIPPGIVLNYPGINWKNAAEVATLPEVQSALNK